MAFSITNAAAELQEETKWQRTPNQLPFSQYENMIVKGIRRLLIDTGRALEYDNSLFFDNVNERMFDIDFKIDEVAYISICAKMEFFKGVQTDSNNMVSYTTDAISVTGANKPYEHLQDTLDKLENERRILFYKMVRYVHGYQVSD